MTEHSAGLLLWREAGATREVWIGHMGGPFWARKQERAWSIPKGLIDAGEDTRTAAMREFAEETGVPAPDLEYRPLGEFRATSRKLLTVFAAEAPAFDQESLDPGTFELEWPPRSGRVQSFPELDVIRWVPIADARRLLVAGQVAVLDALDSTAAR